MGHEVSREKLDMSKMFISPLSVIALAASPLSLIPSSTAPLSSRPFATVSKDGLSADNETGSNMQLYKIKEKYSNLIIDQIQLAES
jgi:hypothetical protein